MKKVKIIRILIPVALIVVPLILVYPVKSRSLLKIQRCNNCNIEVSREVNTERIPLLISDKTVIEEKSDDLCFKCKAYKEFYNVLEERKKMLEQANRIDENGLKVGIWYEFFSDSILIDRYIRRMQGDYDWADKSVYDNKGIKANGCYNNGLKNGQWKYNYTLYGDSALLTYIDGNLDGEYYLFWSNRKVLIKANYENGLLDGHYEFYREDGSLAYEGTYSKGEKDGTWTGYYPDGSVRYRSEFRNGVNQDDYSW